MSRPPQPAESSSRSRAATAPTTPRSPPTTDRCNRTGRPRRTPPPPGPAIPNTRPAGPSTSATAAGGYSFTPAFAEQPAAVWAKANAHRFGFVVRYPWMFHDITGYYYEPWHLRYSGWKRPANEHPGYRHARGVLRAGSGTGLPLTCTLSAWGISGTPACQREINAIVQRIAALAYADERLGGVAPSRAASQLGAALEFLPQLRLRTLRALDKDLARPDSLATGETRPGANRRTGVAWFLVRACSQTRRPYTSPRTAPAIDASLLANCGARDVRQAHGNTIFYRRA